MPRMAKIKKGSVEFPRQSPLSRQSPTFPLSSIIGDKVLTSVFGMGTGVTPCLYSPAIHEVPFLALHGDKSCNVSRFESLQTNHGLHENLERS